ncbi:hypothetical protein PVL29_012008 [Vitis rotundifolia]|uniref:Uncharacterized protein n=1 Tax=Vitis rotundifolia TaxID=103349 RepID=A0AA38ZPW2_VITRO|nr:hypothetical protein PVL29_012008 [Vitis rotundifolia]
MVSKRVPERRSYSSDYRRIGDRRRIESVRVPENKRKKGSYPGDYRRKDIIRASIGEYLTDRESNSCEFHRIQERNDGIRASTGEEIIFGRVPESNRQTGNRIRACTGESKIEIMILSGRVSENVRETGNRIRASTGESKTEMMVSGRVPKKRSYSGEYRRETDRRTINLCEYRRIQDRKDGIRASTREEMVFGRVPGNRRYTKNRIVATSGE